MDLQDFVTQLERILRIGITIVAAYLVNRFAAGRDAFARVPDVFRYAALAAFAATTVSPTIGVTTLALFGYAAWSGYASIWLMDPRPDHTRFVELIDEAFQLSEASNTPVICEFRIRACHMHGRFVCKDNKKPAKGK